MDEDFPTLKPRRIQNQNVVHRLEKRRICSGRPGAHWYRVRCFHQNLFPNFTVVNVEKPPCFLRKFSPDGRCFIAFSSDQTSLEVRGDKPSIISHSLNQISCVILIFHLVQSVTHTVCWNTKFTRKYCCYCSSYRYTNTKAARQLRICLEAKKERLFSPPTISAPSTYEDACLSAFSLCSTLQMWPRMESTWTGSAASSQTTAAMSLSDRLFMFPRSRPHSSLRYQLSKKFKKGRCRNDLFFSCCSFHLHFSHQVYRNNESVTPNPRSPLEDYSLHIIDLHTGRLCDTRSFKCDKIILSHNQGLYLYRNILAVLSVQQQTIHVFQVSA